MENINLDQSVINTSINQENQRPKSTKKILVFLVFVSLSLNILMLLNLKLGFLNKLFVSKNQTLVEKSTNEQIQPTSFQEKREPELDNMTLFNGIKINYPQDKYELIRQKISEKPLGAENTAEFSEVAFKLKEEANQNPVLEIIDLSSLDKVTIQDVLSKLIFAGDDAESKLRAVTISGQQYQFTGTLFYEGFPKDEEAKCFAENGVYTDSLVTANKLAIIVTLTYDAEFCLGEKKVENFKLSDAQIEEILEIVESISW